MTVQLRTDIITQNYMRFCYDCTKAEACDTEEQCLACWEERGMLAAEHGEEEEAVTPELTRTFLRLQYD